MSASSDLNEFDAVAAAALFERYRREDSPRPSSWNESLDLLLAHRSHRNYLPQQVPSGALETIIYFIGLVIKKVNSSLKPK